jgi:hypothetical protein
MIDSSDTQQAGESKADDSFDVQRWQTDAPPASAANEDFLTLWKDADPDISLLKEAKVEYAKLQ